MLTNKMKGNEIKFKYFCVLEKRVRTMLIWTKKNRVNYTVLCSEEVESKSRKLNKEQSRYHTLFCRKEKKKLTERMWSFVLKNCVVRFFLNFRKQKSDEWIRFQTLGIIIYNSLCMPTIFFSSISNPAVCNGFF